MFCALFIAGISVTGPFGAQSADSGSIVGRVTDVAGVIPGVEVAADAPGFHRVAVTDAEGRYEIRGVPTSDRAYTLTFMLQGYWPKKVSAVVARAGEAIVVDAQLELPPPPDGQPFPFPKIPFDEPTPVWTVVQTADAVVHVRLSKSVKIHRVSNVQNVDDAAIIVEAVKLPRGMENDATIPIRLLCTADREVPSELLLFLHADGFGHFVGNVDDCIAVSGGRVPGWSNPAAGIAPGALIEDVMARLRAKPAQ